MQFTSNLPYQGVTTWRPCPKREKRVFRTLLTSFEEMFCSGGSTAWRRTRERMCVYREVAERDASLLGSLMRNGTALRLNWNAIRAVAFLEAWCQREERSLKQALLTWPPEGVDDQLKGRSARLHAFIAHTLGYPSHRLPPFLFQNVVSEDSALLNFGLDPGGAFLAAFTEMMRGVSPRQALRSHFPRLALTPAATRCLLELPMVRVRQESCPPHNFQYLRSPLAVLRYAQFAALLPQRDEPFSTAFVGLLSFHLLPHSVCATGAEEDFWLRAARFIVHRMPPPALSPNEDEDERPPVNLFDLEQLLSNAQLDFDSAEEDFPDWPALCDVAFWLHCKYRDAEKAGGGAVPPGFAPWAGMTLRSLSARAESYREVSAPMDDIRHWRLPLAWPATRFAGVGVESHKWEGEVLCSEFPTYSAGEARETLPGTWRAYRLASAEEVQAEGHAQMNCLRHLHYDPTHDSSVYWSLRFTPAAEARPPLPPGALDRVTVQLRPFPGCTADDEGSFTLREARAKMNVSVPRGAMDALLAQWQRASGLSIRGRGLL